MSVCVPCHLCRVGSWWSCGHLIDLALASSWRFRTHSRFLIIITHRHTHTAAADGGKHTMEHSYIARFTSEIRLWNTYTLQCYLVVPAYCVYCSSGECCWCDQCVMSIDLWSERSDSHFQSHSATTRRTIIMNRKLRICTVGWSDDLHPICNHFECIWAEMMRKSNRVQSYGSSVISLIRDEALQTQSNSNINFHIIRMDVCWAAIVHATHNELIWSPRKNQRHKHLLPKIGISRHFTTHRV